MNRCSKIHVALNREINRLLLQHAKPGGALVDIGCWDGGTTMTYASTLKTSTIFGVEGIEEPIAAAQKLGIHVVKANIETEPIALETASADTVVCNQVFEHLKNVFYPMDEIARLLKPGGVLVISVPNLASFHNRAMLALGLQPSSIRIMGPHVRGFSYGAFLEFLQLGGVYEVVRTRGVGFYPFTPSAGGNFVANLWKSACHTPIFVLRRTSLHGFSFQRHYQERGESTLM